MEVLTARRHQKRGARAGLHIRLCRELLTGRVQKNVVVDASLIGDEVNTAAGYVSSLESRPVQSLDVARSECVYRDGSCTGVGCRSLEGERERLLMRPNTHVGSESQCV